MHVRRIHVSGFTVHDEFSVDLPERGIVVVTGPNGSGKSSLIEGVAVGLWGRTLRGPSPWRKDQPGQASVLTDRVDAFRQRSKGGKSVLSFALRGGAVTTDYETATKAQEALERVVGSFEVWRRTAAFSSSDAAHFTTATDAERKRFLEAVLGLGRLDVAGLRAAAEALRLEKLQDAAEDKAKAAAMNVGSLRNRLAEEEQELTQVPSSTSREIAAAEVEKARAEKMLVQAQGDHDAARARYAALVHDVDEASSKACYFAAQVVHLKRGACHVCGSTLQEEKALEMVAQAEEWRRVHEATAAMAKDRLEVLLSERAEIGAEVEALAAALARARERLSAMMHGVDERRRREAVIGQVKDSLAIREAELAKATEDVAVLDHRAAVARAAAQVLGIKGVRASILSGALRGVEGAANHWLGAVAGDGLRLRLREWTERRDGTASEAISLEVEGAGGGHGYMGASAGERRRIDVALLLALSEVASAAAGRTPGTLFFDEVFDALDVDGVEAVSEVLSDLARERAVVVVTHSQPLAAALPAALRLRFG